MGLADSAGTQKQCGLAAVDEAQLGEVEELAREMSGEQETATDLPGEVSYAYYSVEPDAG